MNDPGKLLGILMLSLYPADCWPLPSGDQGSMLLHFSFWAECGRDGSS